jgi:hypothetical protein
VRPLLLLDVDGVLNAALADDGEHEDNWPQWRLACGFAAPDDESPNSAASIDHPGDAERLALRVVGMLTAVFAVYVG